MKKNLTLLFLVLPLFIFAQRPEMVLVEGGSFTMGNSSSPNLNEKPEHEITLSNFYMSKYEVTFNDFDLFCNTTGYPKPSDGGFGRGDLPVINVSWDGAIMYCNWMSRRFNLEKAYNITVDSNGMKINSVNWDANGFRLPTEAEWEYAVLGGNAGGTTSTIEELAWFADNSDGTPHPVGTLQPNSLDIYDMQGNAWEWCWDFYADDYYGQSPQNDPHGPDNGMNKIYRGGNFNSSTDFLNRTKRYNLHSKLKEGMIGIRLVQSNQ